MYEPQFSKTWLKPHSLDEAANAILTGRNLEQYKQTTPMLLHMVNLPSGKPITLIDFGCGMGRGLYHIGKRFPNWKLIGFDNDLMVDRIKQVWGDDMPPNATWTSKWAEVHDMLNALPFEKDGSVLIYCDLVLQHLPFTDLLAVLPMFRHILMPFGGSGKLVVHGRRTLDDGKTCVWPAVFLSFTFEAMHGTHQYQQLFGGDPGEHMTATFTPRFLY